MQTTMQTTKLIEHKRDQEAIRLSCTPLGRVAATAGESLTLKQRRVQKSRRVCVDGFINEIRAAMGEASVVLIGEATHGTQEFYEVRADITKALIEHDDFDGVLCEGDFPAFFDLNTFVGGVQSCASALPGSLEDAMQGLRARFPVWMWHNEVMREFIEWLRAHNASRRADDSRRAPVSIFGLDIYSLFRSAEVVLSYLERVDPEMCSVVSKRYETLGSFCGEHGEVAYSRALAEGRVDAQTDNVVSALTDILSKEAVYTARQDDGDSFFSASENAHVVSSAEAYYRQSFMGGAVTWNIRDRSMAETLQHALHYLARRKNNMTRTTSTTTGTTASDEKRRARVIVWAHNSHVGDANATQMSERGECNLGSLVRGKLGEQDAFIIGFSTFQGTVRAATSWGGHSCQIDLTQSLPGSHEALLHSVAKKLEQDAFGLILRDKLGPRDETASVEGVREALGRRRLERFVGVQYVRRTERHSHYSFCSMSKQFDAVIHIDTTSALRPIEELPKPSVRPGTIDYSAWDRFATDIDTDEFGLECN